MNIFKVAVTAYRFARAAVAVVKALPQLASVDNRGGWWPIIRESFAGAWQQNVEVDTTTVLSFAALYACITTIAADIAKCRPKVMELGPDGIWVETSSPSFSPVLRKPNHFQTRIQFFECWVASKLIHGNAYILKARDNRGVVVKLFVLDPTRCHPLVAPDGSVYYKLNRDDLAGVDLIEEKQPIVPASEIIHDIMVPLFHPLVGVSPIRACGLAALQGLRIQENSTLFFQNGSKPGGVLTAPGFISDETAGRIKAYWEANFTGENVGKVAVLGDGLKYEGMSDSAVDAQLIEQLRMSGEMVCTAFKMPPYKVNVGPPPAHNNVDALDQQYYSQCLQTHFESIELLLDEGLGMSDGSPQKLGVEFDLDCLMRMDTPTLVKTAKEAITGGMSPNEARRRFYGLAKATGGDSPMLQQQNFSLEALAKRDAKDDPFASASTSTPAPQSKNDDEDDAEKSMLQRELLKTRFQKQLAA